MRVLVLLAVLCAGAASAAADDVAFLRGGPKADAARQAAIAALGDARRDMLPCWRRGSSAVEIAVTTDASGVVVSAAARTDGPAAQCVAGILAVATLARSGAWSGVVAIAPATAGGGGTGDDVGAALGKHGADLRACQKADPKASGLVEIDLRVHADGTISDVAVSKSLSAALDACLVKAVSKLKLDDYHGKEVHYRLGLSYAGGGGDARGGGGGGGAPPDAPKGAPTKRGPLAVDQMLPVIERDRAHIDRCGKGVAKSGTLVIRFTVRKDGTVKNLGVKESLGDAKVEACVLDRFARLQFPTASDETQVQFPLTFTAP